MLRNKKLIKFLYFVFLSALLLFGSQALAEMQSNSFKVWLDSLTGIGGNATSGSFQIDSNLSSQLGNQAQSARLQEKVGFAAIDEQPTVGFVVQAIASDFGQLSAHSPAYSSHTFSAFTNSKSGYRIKVFGQSLHSIDHTIIPIGQIAEQSIPGSEQFGINLAANTIPLIGASPSNGIGMAEANYDTANYYAYQEGDIIARAANYSFQTDYTVTVLINIAEETPAGDYSTVLTYEFIPLY